MPLLHDLAGKLDPDVRDLILAAVDGDQALDEALRGVWRDRPEPASPADPGDTRLFLESVKVRGFRGIGPMATIPLTPAPGLTVITGRNGSGKSSFAEAVEFALTADSTRWSQRPAAFRTGWRNLHQDGPAGIQVTLRPDSGPSVTIRRTWPAGSTDLAAAELAVLHDGGPLPDWAGRIDRYRPFLSARDLERVITAKPTELYDAIAPILGLGPLPEADKRLQRQRKIREDRVKSLKMGYDRLRVMLGETDDPRAVRALSALASRDLTALAALTGDDAESMDVRAVTAARRLTSEELPDPQPALLERDAAAKEAEAAAGTDSAAAHRAAELLRQAVDLHRDGGDQPCPVCRSGHLDDAWQRAALTELERLGDAATTARAARDRHASADRAVAELLRDVRGRLTPLAAALARQLPEAAAALRSALDALPVGGAREAGGVWEPGGGSEAGGVWEAVVGAHSRLAAEAADWLDRRHDGSREPAAAIRRWIDEARVVRAEAAELERLVRARTALGHAADRIRTERLGTFVSQADHLWRRLRRESNVDLRQITMSGVNTSRRVEFPVAVDDAATSALAVMSQGELHALGLAVFLPRACADASPYRFVVIDDPVQSMDPSKVDGLAEILAETSRTRQLIVFTHDDRLPESLDRLGIPVTRREVVRAQRSVVTVREPEPR
ncbi:AAA family ATPase [Catenuloplanes japonicus]|uniref:AAA family ATPase n=1 Tax=Catenuloplanes japonicus TaxID=33876 RepID=UPI0018DCEF50|nr:AAA family ATPase [Catenuloplanes japonicus]